MGPTPTRVIVFAATLPQAAWMALLRDLPQLQSWGAASNLDGVLAVPESRWPTAVLIDHPRLPTQLIQELNTSLPGYGLLCLVNRYDLHETISLLRAGATGSLVRDAPVAELARALIAAGRGEIVLPPELASRALAALARGAVTRPPSVEALTDRERDVLSLLTEGLTNKDIAQSLFLSVRTVEAHLRSIYSKLGISSRTEAVLWAVQHRKESGLGDFT